MRATVDADTLPLPLPVDRRADSDGDLASDHESRPAAASLLARLAGPALLLVALGAFAVSAVEGAATPTTGVGLAATLPVASWVAVVAAGFGVASELSARSVRPPAAWSALGVLVLCTFGVPSVMEGEARLTTTWLHLGFIDTIRNHGVSPLGVDSRFSWPGFFAAWAAAERALPGLDLMTVARWFPLVIVACWAVAVFSLAQNFLATPRSQFAAVVLFVLGEWIEQDYFSPQAMSYLVYLVVLDLVLKHFANRPHGRTTAAFLPEETSTRVQGELVAAYGLCALGVLVLAPTHQLTPVILVIQLLLLGVAGKQRAFSLALFATICYVGWFVYGASEFWLNQLQLATGDAGDVATNLASGLTDRLRGDPAQTGIKFARLCVAAFSVGLGLVGAVLLVRRRRLLVVPMLALSSAVLPLAQAYGGEVLLRSLLYGLPFWSILGVVALEAATGARIRARMAVRPIVVGRTVAAGIVVAALASLLVVLRGGNDAYAEVSADDVLYEQLALDVTPNGEMLLHPEVEGPYFLERVAEVRNARNFGSCRAFPLANACVPTVRPHTVIVLPSMERHGVLLDGLKPGWTRDFVDELVHVEGYRVLAEDGQGRAVLVRGQT